MSIAKAISNAMSGLTATARGTETVASNIANVMTPGYARRDMVVSAQLHGGGVRIDGITRSPITGTEGNVEYLVAALRDG